MKQLLVQVNEEGRQGFRIMSSSRELQVNYLQELLDADWIIKRISSINDYACWVLLEKANYDASDYVSVFARK